MKLLLFLFIILITSNKIKSFDIDSIDPSHWESDEGYEHHKCWGKNFGYYTEFALTAYNTYFPTPYGIIPVSFFEGGLISADFKSQQMYVHFGIVGNNVTTWGKYWGYGSNSTEYVLINGTCTANKLSYPFPPSVPKFKKVGETKIGQVDVDVVIMKHQEKYTNYTRQCTLIQKGTCIPMSNNVGNVDKTNKGFTMMNFYKYEPKARKDKFDLPSECWDVQPSDLTPSFRLNKNNIVESDLGYQEEQSSNSKQPSPKSIPFHHLF
ncbi:hypothetical protein RB653_008150 [Dictyostelium firmibasis]|uniref:Uncharacterized protein n=1 Tax=Dictyostelium firmibasis TaxID=79012 RepID=A0AAN7YP29_9MYCE